MKTFLLDRFFFSPGWQLRSETSVEVRDVVRRDAVHGRPKRNSRLGTGRWGAVSAASWHSFKRKVEKTLGFLQIPQSKVYIFVNHQLELLSTSCWICFSGDSFYGLYHSKSPFFTPIWEKIFGTFSKHLKKIQENFFFLLSQKAIVTYVVVSNTFYFQPYDFSPGGLIDLRWYRISAINSSSCCCGCTPLENYTP